MADSRGNSARTDRRTLIKGGIAATSAAYAAPQILRTGVAGAQTSLCYVMKFQSSGNSSLTGPNWDNSDNCGQFNTAIGNSFMGSLVGGIPPGTMVVPSPNGAEVPHTVTIPPGCEFRLVGWKAATGFFWKTNTTSGLVDFSASSQSGCPAAPAITTEAITFSGQTATIAPRQGVSHVVVVICCPGSPLA